MVQAKSEIGVGAATGLWPCYLHLKKTPLVGDIEIAHLEAEALGISGLARVSNTSELEGFVRASGVNSPASHTWFSQLSENGFGFIGAATEVAIAAVVKRSAFFREILVFLPTHADASFRSETLPRGFLEHALREVSREGATAVVRIIPVSVYLEMTALLSSVSSDMMETEILNLLKYIDSGFDQSKAPRVMKGRALPAKLNDYASHGFHLYKARFFPRFARSVANICLGPNVSGRCLLDPFVGSGTALIESSLMGVDSIGVDIDPLSAFITRVKTESLTWRVETIRELNKTLGKISAQLAKKREQPTEQVSIVSYAERSWTELETILPSYIEKRLDVDSKKNAEDAVRSIRESILETVESEIAKDFFMLMLSDSLARKFRLRFHGLGFGRFSIEFNKAGITQLFTKQCRKALGFLLSYRIAVDAIGVGAWVEEHSPKIICADFLEADLPTFDGVVTSPPYLPAASGRESYLRSKGPSLLTLGLITEEKQIWTLEDKFIGSLQGTKPIVLSERDVVDAELPDSAKQLLVFLLKDKNRWIKAYPTYRYLLKMKEVFERTAAVIGVGCIAAFIASTHTTFYRYSTRETLNKVDVASILEDVAMATEKFVLDKRLDIPLAKALGPARPRSRDAYCESLLVFRRTNETPREHRLH